MDQDEANSQAEWYDHFCFIGMGDHYMQFNYEPTQVNKQFQSSYSNLKITNQLLTKLLLLLILISDL